MWIRKKVAILGSALIALALVFSAGIYTGIHLPQESKVAQVLTMKPPAPLPSEVDFAPFWEVWNIIENNYVDAASIKRQDLVYGAIAGMLHSLEDPYSVFFPPKENEEFQSEVKGEFQGVGMEVGIRKDTLTVIAPIKGTPAERAGIKAGDKIIKIDEKTTADLALEEAVRLIRGPRGTKVKLTIFRNSNDESLVIEVTRDIINIPTLETEVKDGNIFVIKLYNFYENSPQAFGEALRQMSRGGQTKLILDLRNNPGGFLEASIQIASHFIREGNIIVTEDGGKSGKREHFSYGYNDLAGIPVVVLINQGSASASEILAGALHDHGIAKLVGEKSFGKGSVQEVLPLRSKLDTSVKITIAKWLTPNGTSISEKGIEPDIEVKPTKDDIENVKDPVMEKAVQMLRL